MLLLSEMSQSFNICAETKWTYIRPEVEVGSGKMGDFCSFWDL